VPCSRYCEVRGLIVSFLQRKLIVFLSLPGSDRRSLCFGLFLLIDCRFIDFTTLALLISLVRKPNKISRPCLNCAAIICTFSIPQNTCAVRPGRVVRPRERRRTVEIKSKAVLTVSLGPFNIYTNRFGLPWKIANSIGLVKTFKKLVLGTIER
jgi:hypothetical protein